MAEGKQTQKLCAKISEIAKDSAHLDKLKVSDKVYKLLLDDLKTKRRNLDKKLGQIKTKRRKCGEIKGKGKPSTSTPKKKKNLQ